MEKAIKRAIEGGWNKEKSPNITTNNDGVWVDFHGGGDTRTLHSSDILLDPAFWMALGKSEGWKFYYHTSVYKAGKITSIGGDRLDKKEVYPEWQYHQHRLIDALAEGKTADEFFNSILN